MIGGIFSLFVDASSLAVPSLTGRLIIEITCRPMNGAALLGRRVALLTRRAYGFGSRRRLVAGGRAVRGESP